MLRNHNTLKNSVSKHCFGVAVDIQFTKASKSDYVGLASAISKGVKFDKLLLEYRDSPAGKKVWLHIEYDRRNSSKAGTILTLNNDVTYSQGLVNLA